MNRKPRRLILTVLFAGSFVILLAPRAASGSDQLAASPDIDNRLIGRLFYTPYQRDQIDARRQSEPTPPTQVSTRELSPSTRYNGSVLRSNGPATAWVDGMRLDQIDQSDASIRLQLNGRRLAVRSANGLKLVEPGQTLPTQENASGLAAIAERLSGDSKPAGKPAN